MSTEKRTVFLEGRTVTLRPVVKDDSANFARGMNDPSMRDFLTSGIFPISLQQEEEALSRMALDKSRTDVFLVIEKKDEAGAIGAVGLHRINWIDRTATTGSMIIDEENRSKGYGTDAKMQLLNYAFTTLGLRLIRSGVIGNNPRSMRALVKQGYVEVGRVPNWFFRNGQFHDEVVFVLTPEAFAPVYSAWCKKA